jgi:pyrroline-5-carboxylate reductase
MASRRISRDIGIIGGTGWLGKAIGRALLASGFIDPAALWVSNRSGSSQGYEDWPGVRFTTNNSELVDHCAVVLVSVLPRDFGSVDADLSDRLVISVMAGASVQVIARHTGARRIIRALPNAAAEVRLSYTPWYATKEVAAEEGNFIQALFEACGQADRVPSEDQIDYFTALTGPGPGFIAFYADAMNRHATSKGVEPATAERAVRQLFHGTGVMLARSSTTPGEIVRMFVDYAGTTAEGLRIFQASALAEDIGRGIDAAYRKARIDLTGLGAAEESR